MMRLIKDILTALHRYIERQRDSEDTQKGKDRWNEALKQLDDAMNGLSGNNKNGYTQ